jgi:hypothetical protein
MADKLRNEPRLGGRVARLLGLTDGGRVSLGAAAVGLAGAAAFVASLPVDWLRVTVAPMREYGIFGGEYSFGLTTAEYGIVYPIGLLGLLTLTGLAVPRPDLARRLRLSSLALGIGLIGVLVATTNDLRDVIREGYGYPVFFAGEVPAAIEEVIDGQTYAPLPGQMLAYAAVALLVVAVWVAGIPARAGLGTPAVSAPVDAVTDDPSAAPVSPADAPYAGAAVPAGTPSQPLDHSSPVDGATRVGYVDGLTVVASDAIDLGGQADILRN